MARVTAAEQVLSALAAFRGGKERGEVPVQLTDHLAVEAVSSFLSHYQETGGYLREAITLLCEMATVESEVPAVSGLRGIFPLFVERLSDSFNPEYCLLYDRAFSQVIDFCRHLPAGKGLDAGLRAFGLLTEQDLVNRKVAIRAQGGRFGPLSRQSVQKVLVLSRVTWGAEVAVSSVIMSGMKQTCPHAEVVLLGSPRLGELFGGDARIRVRPVPYEREGGLIRRLNSWLDLVEAVRHELQGLPPSAYLIIDPDSRLTQLGLLPVVREEGRYCFFESRSYRESGVGTLGQLTAAWVGKLFGRDAASLPYVSLPDADRTFGQQLGLRLRRGGAHYLLSVSFGVGGNLRKRIPDPFEERCLLALLEEGCVVILDKGAGPEELERANRLVAALRAKGKMVTEVDAATAPDQLRGPALRSPVVTWEGGIGGFSALIAASDEYLGYDSAGQHIAAALGVPALAIFSHCPDPLFAERWQPHGPGTVKVVVVDCSAPSRAEGDADSGGDLDPVLAEVMAAHRQVRE